MLLSDLTLLAKDLVLEPGENPKPFLDRLAFRCYIKTGHVPARLAWLQKRAADPNFKFNPHHDELGRFTFGDGGGDDDSQPDSDEDTAAPDRQLAQEEVLPDIPFESSPASGPKPSPNFQPPTNPPQYPPTQIPQGWRVREMSPTEQYPYGYWRLEKPLDNGGWQGINPSTMKPGSQPETHIPFPPGLTG